MKSAAQGRGPNRGGFSLVELLVVISIIVLLAALAVPSLMKARTIADQSHCRVNLREIVRGCRMYANDARMHRGSTAYALPNTAPTTGNWGTQNPASLWLLVEHNYTNRLVYLCPEAKSRLGHEKLSETATSFIPDSGEPRVLSYSYLSMVGTYGTQSTSAALSASTIIFADGNPCTTPGSQSFNGGRTTWNSLNHTGEQDNLDGEEGAGNVAHLDESAEWRTHDPDSGNNDIYVGGNNDNGERGALDDVFCLP